MRERERERERGGGGERDKRWLKNDGCLVKVSRDARKKLLFELKYFEGKTNKQIQDWVI